MSEEEKAALHEAARSKKDDETFENALGRAMRHAHLGYESYVKVIGIVRHMADKKNIPLVKAAKLLLKGPEQERQ
jgi:hypothetical protein